MLNHLIKETVMFRKLTFVAIAVGVTAIASTATPAAASPKVPWVPPKAHNPHERTTVGPSYEPMIMSLKRIPPPAR